VLEFHGGPSRSGVYVDPDMTRALVGDGGLHRDPGFAGGLTGQVYAQPLYFENASGPDLVIAATESNTVYAFDAFDGGVVWQRALPQAMTSSSLPCGNISPNHGINRHPGESTPRRGRSTWTPWWGWPGAPRRTSRSSPSP